MNYYQVINRYFFDSKSALAVYIGDRFNIGMRYRMEIDDTNDWQIYSPATKLWKMMDKEEVSDELRAIAESYKKKRWQILPRLRHG